MVIMTCISLMISGIEDYFIYLLASCLLWENVYSDPLLIFWLNYLFSCYWLKTCIFLINFKYESLIRYVICKYFLPFNKLPFHFTYGLLCCAKNFLVWCIPTFIFAFVAFALDVKSKKYHCWSQCQGVYHLCFFRNFMVSRLTFKSLMRVEFVFVSIVRQWPSFILLHAAVQFSLHHLLKRLSFPHYMVLAPLL